MKAYDISKRTLALMFESEVENVDKAFRNNFCNILSAVAAESLPYENSIRRAEGREEMKIAPVISEMEEELPMSDEICSVALPFGVAAYFYQDDGENYNSSIYRERFVNALYEAKKCFFTDVNDVYGGENI